MMQSRQMINLRISVKNTATDGRNTFSTTRILEYRNNNVCAEFCRVNHIKTLNCRIIPGLPVCLRTTEMFIYKERIINLDNSFLSNLLILKVSEFFYLNIPKKKDFKSISIKYIVLTG